MSKHTSKINRPNTNDMNELLNNNNEVEKHKSVSKKENNKSKEQ